MTPNYSYEGATSLGFRCKSPEQLTTCVPQGENKALQAEGDDCLKGARLLFVFNPENYGTFGSFAANGGNGNLFCYAVSLVAKRTRRRLS
jgi:hypothetical protein